MRLAWIASLGLLTAAAPQAAEIADRVHLGVASCDGSNCHGKADKQPNVNVWLNEYRVWRAQDYHSRAYRTLLSEQSRSIAAKLGLASASTAAECLNCHADNVPANRRGPKFQITDGVACEACHGGAQGWIDTHDDRNSTHERNVANGMYPSDDPSARARLCLSCHMGTVNRFLSHRLYGAGHPRLSFELENFTANQPPHYTVDDDYRRRKGDIAGVTLWLTGQLEASQRYLELLQSGNLKAGQWVPEFAFFDCQGCHHGLDPNDVRWRAERRAQGVAPGAMRLQDHHLRIAETVCDVVAPGETGELRGRINALMTAGQKGRDATVQAARALSEWLSSRGAGWRKQGINREQIRQIRRKLIQQASADTFVDYGTAEQGLLSIVTLTTYLNEESQLAGAIDTLFTALGNDENFNPGRYQAAARNVAGRF
jgi:hypothetical protein